jgi:hypothetical protein
MLPQYAGEDVAGNEIWSGNAVRYLTEAERSEFRLTFREGLICDARGELFDTSNAETVFSGTGRAIFVMDADGNFFASKAQSIGAFHHSSFVAGGSVAAAGEIEVAQGMLVVISDKSGHYRPSQSYTYQAIERLKENNISLNGADFEFVGPP